MLKNTNLSTSLRSKALTHWNALRNQSFFGHEAACPDSKCVIHHAIKHDYRKRLSLGKNGPPVTYLNGQGGTKRLHMAIKQLVPDCSISTNCLTNLFI